MLIYDDIYSWEGWGGKLRLASGKCRLRIYDLKKGDSKGLDYLRPIIVVVSDIPESEVPLKVVSVRSCIGHIATKVAQEFNIDPHRMLFIEYCPAETYGEKKKHIIPERYEAVEFTWYGDKAMQPKWRPLKPPMLDIIKKLMS